MPIELRETGESHRIDLIKPTAQISDKEIKINLNWNDGRHGFLGFLKSPVDLDLGCFIELRDGSLWCIDGLQFSHGKGGRRDELSRQGRFTDRPYVWHYGDERSGGNGEIIFVNPAGIHEIKRMLIYTFIYDGVAHWTDTNAVVYVDVPDNDAVKVKMGEQSSSHRFCAIASLDFDDTSIRVEKLVTFFDGHEDCAAAYNWNFKFASGTKD